MMSNQQSFIEEIDHDFHINENVDGHFDLPTDHDSINGYEGPGSNIQSSGFYRENAVNYGIEGNNRAESFSNDSSIDNGDSNALALVPHSNHEIGVESLPFSTQQQIEEERLRGDILRYLVGNSNGTYHYSAELRAIIHDVIGIPASTTQTEFSETVTSLLDILHSDPEKRFLVSGEGDNIHIKRCFVRGDEEEISDLVEEWRALIAIFLLESKRSVGLSDIGSSVPRPIRIPTSVKLIFIMKTDPSNRFILKGDGNAAKARYNMQADSYQESVWVDKWRDDIAFFLIKQQWSIPSVGLHEIGTHVVRPFFLPPRVKLLDTLQGDPQQRFVILGFGNDTRVMMRDFRVDEPEIEEFIEHWRRLIASYLLSKSAMPGVSQPLLGLSEIGANVPRPPGVPPSVKLIDVMRADPLIRFLIKGDGNALRVKINSRALDPNCPMYPPHSPHGQGFQGNPFLDDGDYRGPGGSPGQMMREGEAFRRDSLPGPGIAQMERELLQQQQQHFNIKNPAGYPPMRGKEPPFLNRNPHPFSQENPRVGMQQQQLMGHSNYNEMDPTAMRRQSHLQLQVQQFHQQNTRLSAPPGHSPPMQSALPLTPAMAPGHPYRERERDPRLRNGPLPLPGHQPVGPGLVQGLGPLPKRPSGNEWNLASTMSLDRQRDMQGLPPSHFNPGVKSESGSYNPPYGSNFNSQRTSLESNSDYSAYLSTTNSSFISQDAGDYVRKDHLGVKTPISRSFSNYTQPAAMGGEGPKHSRSMPGFPTDTLMLGDQSNFPGGNKNEPFGQFMGFGAIGGPMGGPTGFGGPKPPGGMYERGQDSYSSEVSNNEDGLELFRDPNGGQMRPQYRDKEGGQGQGQGQGLENMFLNRNSGASGEAFANKDQFNDGVRSSVSRSSSFGSTLDSLNSYKHIPMGGGNGAEDDHPVRRGAFVIRDTYTNTNTPPGNHNYPPKQFDIRRGNPGQVSLQDVRECLEEDNSNDLTSHDAHSPPHTIKLHNESDPHNHTLLNTSQSLKISTDYGSADYSTLSYEKPSGIIDNAANIRHSTPPYVVGTAGDSEHSNVDSFQSSFQEMRGSMTSGLENDSFSFNNSVVNSDVAIGNDDNRSFTGMNKYLFDGAASSSNPVSSMPSPITHIHFGSNNNNGAVGMGQNSSQNQALNLSQSQREDLELSEYGEKRNCGDANAIMGTGTGTGMGMNSGHRGQPVTSLSLDAKIAGSAVGGEDKEDEEECTQFSRRPSSALSDRTADYLQDDFTMLTTDTHTFIPLDKWMIKVWLHIVFSGFDSDIIEGFISKLRDDGGFVTVQDLLDAQARGELSRDALASIAGFKVGHCNRLEKSLASLAANKL